MSKLVHDAAPVKAQTAARQGETSGHMRWVLLGSIGLTIAVFAAAAFGTSFYH